MNENNLNLYKFYWDCGSAGSIDGVFISTEEDVNRLVGKQVYFGEVLGKHSEVYGVIEDGEIEKLTVQQSTVDDLYSSVGETISGYNPIHYVQGYDEEEE